MPAADWTCGRCAVTTSWMAGVERPELPANWVRQGGEVYCLACRRERASEAGVADLPDDASNTSRQQVRASACVEFEVARDPDALDGEVARACRTSIHTVRKARQQLSAAPGS